MDVRDYQPPRWLFNGHIETIYPALLRKVTPLPYERERLITPDDDFLDLDWYRNGHPRLVIISHGLEGNSQRAYVLGMVRHFATNGFDVVAWNYRGCSGEINRQLRFYHSGATDDLAWVISRAVQQYESIALVGFSLGGNLTLQYVGTASIPSAVQAAVAISVPLHLASSCAQIGRPQNRLYALRFLKSLKAKVRQKAQQRSDLPLAPLRHVHTLLDFDELYTAPLHGFAHAQDYYQRCSSLFVLPAIPIPTLLLNAVNDPFLSPACFPDLSSHPTIQAHYPPRGGHVGFAQSGPATVYWSEEYALTFCKKHLP